ncbi:uncharacterized protein B0P05DRAFT_641872 [Gilbertella persicaria]|uniref:Trichome birefringence-like C-terminal domain-containing protein n=1 Tax=Rhizopus stolonifer TaxID=4846 RepID=A0A367J3J5_RHIST|nr:uncharacterized protein B0P05DRAFT_641872 [Gilbertella persicaria]KAI8049133.1 hypothetical protein B0P05DRAFT_641872 [Gilbertella persicaria]RCH84524.1 hypothetical protein CU098_007470 [Rhizopus stolonifer]
MVNRIEAPYWRRLNWPRIILYGLSTVLVIQLIKTFSVRPSVKDDTHLQLDTTRLVRDFPWYQRQGHPNLSPLQQHPKYITTHLSTQERQTLQENMIKKAREAVAHEFQHIKGIPGSSVYAGKPEAARQFRSLVDCWTTGEWVSVTSQSAHWTMPHFQDPLYGSCDRKFKKTGGVGRRPATNYVWKSKCDASIDLDPGKWCSVLNGRHLMLVGDLIQYQLHELFLDTLRDGPATCFGELNCKDHTVCTSPYRNTRLRYLRNDVLSTRRKMNANHGHPTAEVIEWPFTSATLIRHYPVLILNRAPVIESDESFIKGLIDTLRLIRSSTGANSLIIYRSTGIGHPFCDDATGPLQAPLTDDQQKKLPFGWSEVARRNAIARVIVEAAGGVFVDLAALTDLRPDGHVGGQDCVRYCIPGPLDSWAQILYQVFLGLEGQLE